jgi:hypothetical protein
MPMRGSLRPAMPGRQTIGQHGQLSGGHITPIVINPHGVRMTNCSAPLGPLDAGHFRASLGYGFFQLFQILHISMGYAKSARGNFCHGPIGENPSRAAIFLCSAVSKA